MSFLESILGNPNQIQSTGFRWSTAGFGTRYLLVISHPDQPVVQSFGTSKTARAKLIELMVACHEENQSFKLLGICGNDGIPGVYQLDPEEAKTRLA